MRLARLLLPVAVLLGAALPAPAIAAQLAWGCRLPAYCNTAVKSSGMPLAGLDTRGDFMGFDSGRANGVPPLGWSGLERLRPGGGRYFVAATGRDQNTQFDVIEMGSRRITPERLGSNRRGPDPQFVLPPASDRRLFSVFQDAGFNQTGSPSSLNNLLAVPIAGPDKKSRVALYDVTDPTDPQRYGSLSPATGLVKPATTVALAQLADGSYLMVLGDYRNNRGGLDFYVAPPGPRPSAWTRKSSWKVSDLHAVQGLNHDFGYTSIHLVGRGSRLYLLGSVQRDGKDTIDTLELSGSTQSPKLTKVDRDTFRCRDARVEQCNFDGGPGVYVTAAGRPLIYGVQRKPISGSGTMTRFEEFRDTVPSETCNRQTAFVQLYDAVNLQDFSLLLDYFDLPMGVPDLFQQSHFLRRASGGRWCLAPGDKARLYETVNPCSGGFVELSGTGRVISDRNFGDTAGIIQRFDNKAACLQWVYDPAAPTPTPPPTGPTPTPTPTATPDPRPDLVFSATAKTRFTITNQGRSAAGPFKATVQSVGTFTFTGLAAGASLTKTYTTASCLDTRTFTVDPDNTVPEAHEDNNTTVFPEHCSQAPGRR